MSLRRKTASAVTWSIFAQAVQAGNNLFVNIVLAHWLAPSDFGLAAMLTVFVGFAALFVEAGLGSALVQLENLERRHESSVFWMQLGFGTILTGIMAACAPLLSSFYDEPRLTMMMRVLSVNFVFLSLGVVQMRLLQRRLQIRKLSVIETTADLVATAMAIYFAWRGAGPYALVARILFASGLRALFLWMSTGWLPLLKLDFASIKEVSGFGGNFTMTMVVNYWTKKVGDIIVGKTLGATELGFYNRAYAIMLQPLSQVTLVLARVLFPVLSRVQDSDEKLKRIYLRAVAAVALVTFPITLGLASVAKPFVLGFMGGQKWAPMIPILQAFCVAGMINAVDKTPMQLFLARNKVGSLLTWRLTTSVVTLGAFAIGSRWGVMGVALALPAQAIVLMYWNFKVPGELIGMKPSEVFRAISGVFAASVVMAAAAWGTGFIMPASWPFALQFVLQVLVGGVVYLGLMAACRVHAFMDVKALMREYVSHRKSSPKAGGPDAGGIAEESTRA